MSKLYIGMDEVGRGAWAGPVAAGAIILPKSSHFSVQIYRDVPTWTIDNIKIRDSKLLNPKERLKTYQWLIKNAVGWGIGTGSVLSINRLGIVVATNIAFRKAVAQVKRTSDEDVEKLLIDAFFVPRVAGFPKSKQHPIVHGDRINIDIAAGSIIAKVYRDELMRSLSQKKEYECFCWATNKGYGTRTHREAIQNFGTTKQHRTLFVRNCISGK